MKFQEILYNSSESSITGSVGVGVRAKTDGASEDVLKALNKSSFFMRKYSAGTFKVPAPKALLENPSAILDYPVNYAYRETKTEDGRIYEYTCSYIRADRVTLDVHMQKNSMTFNRTVR